MKAFLLAAGLGTRLRPITSEVPKCLALIKGKPLIEYWLELFAEYNINEVLVNTHYLHEQVEHFADNHNKADKKVHITCSYEAELLGTGGSVKANAAFIDTGEPFLICYADNFTNANLKAIIDAHCEGGKLLTMGLFNADDPSECGIAELDPENTVIAFEEKPQHPKSSLANAGIYVSTKEIFKYIPDGFSDFGKDIFPKLCGRMQGFEIKEHLLDIGTLERYRQAQADAELYSARRFCS